MDVELRTLARENFWDWYRAVESAFGIDAHEEDRAVVEPLVEFDRAIAAYDGPSIVGTGAAYSFSLTVPGGVVPTAGVTVISVAPTHTRRGILTEMMRRLFADARERGEPLAALWASEAVIYGRFGYGMAGPVASVEVSTRRSAFVRAVPAGVRLRLVDSDAEFVPLARAVHDEVCPRVPGLVARTDAVWDYRMFDPPYAREGDTTWRRLVAETSDGVRGYAIYRQRPLWQNSMPNGVTTVRELFAAEPDAHAALWRYLLDLDLSATVVLHTIAPDDPIFALLVDNRLAQPRLRDGLWVRVLDVPAALAARRYATDGDVVLDVIDSFLPDAGGRFLLRGGPDGATCEPTTRPADLTLSAADLGAVYLGGTRVETLTAAGRVAELTPGAASRAGRMFAWSPAPFNPWIF